MGVGQEQTGLLAMDFAETERPAESPSVPVIDPRRMTSSELRQLGMPHTVYLRCGTIDGQMAYAIHAADGTAMAVVEDLELACELVAAHDMVH
jgi:hypothetical protein